MAFDVVPSAGRDEVDLYAVLGAAAVGFVEKPGRAFFAVSPRRRRHASFVSPLPSAFVVIVVCADPIERLTSEIPRHAVLMI